MSILSVDVPFTVITWASCTFFT